MPLQDRHEDILSILEFRERVSVSELTERLGVSEVTVRKDLTLLEERGFLVRTRGGARLAQDRQRIHPVEKRLSKRVETKRIIAHRASQLIREGDTIFLDSGSTCLELARAIADMDLRVVTNSLDVIAELSNQPRIALHSVGGSFRHEARSFIGPAAVESVRRFHFDKAFLGTSGLSDDGSFSSQNTIESELKRAVIAQARRIVVVVDGSKLGHAAFSIFARPADVHVVITEDGLAARQLASDHPFEVITVSAEPEVNPAGNGRTTGKTKKS